MAGVGSFGELVFEASDELVRTFSTFSRSRKATFAEHEVLEGPKKLQFTGLDLFSADLAVRLDARWVNPEREMQRLEEIQATGNAFPLIIGGRVFGHYVLEDYAETRKTHDGQGRTLVAEVTLKLKEYA